MKKLILMAAVFMAAMSAEAGAKEKYNYFCEEIGAKGKTYLTVNLYDESAEGLSDGRNAEFSVDVFVNDNISDASELYSGIVTARQEDVQVLMKNKKISLGLYLDEDDQAWIKINGKQHRLRCELAEAE